MSVFIALVETLCPSEFVESGNNFDYLTRWSSDYCVSLSVKKTKTKCPMYVLFNKL